MTTHSLALLPYCLAVAYEHDYVSVTALLRVTRTVCLPSPWQIMYTTTALADYAHDDCPCPSVTRMCACPTPWP